MMTFIMLAISIAVGCLVGSLMPTISYEYSKYIAIALMAALDSVIGALSAKAQEKFEMNVFLSGFFVNALIAIFFTMIGEKLNADIYLAAIFVFVYRIFNNLSVIRRYFLVKVENARKGNENEK